MCPTGTKSGNLIVKTQKVKVQIWQKVKVNLKAVQIVAPMGPLRATGVFSVRKVAPAYGATRSDYYHRDGGETVDQKENWAGDGGDHHVL